MAISYGAYGRKKGKYTHPHINVCCYNILFGIKKKFLARKNSDKNIIL